MSVCWFLATLTPHTGIFAVNKMDTQPKSANGRREGRKSIRRFAWSVSCVVWWEANESIYSRHRLHEINWEERRIVAEKMHSTRARPRPTDNTITPFAVRIRSLFPAYKVSAQLNTELKCYFSFFSSLFRFIRKSSAEQRSASQLASRSHNDMNAIVNVFCRLPSALIFRFFFVVAFVLPEMRENGFCRECELRVCLPCVNAETWE